MLYWYLALTAVGVFAHGNAQILQIKAFSFPESGMLITWSTRKERERGQEYEESTLYIHIKYA